MKQILRWILSISLLLVAVPSLSSMAMNEKAGMELVKKKKHKKGKKKSSGKDKGKKSKKGFWSNLFGGS